jgi:F420-dependent oxidoreductase-like protein
MSICLDPARPWHHLQKLAQRVDAAGWYAVYLCDHFMPHDPAGRVVDGPVLECWTTLSTLAVQTTTVRVGTLVLSNTYRHPAVLANMAATLDQLAGGRLVLGIGAGWQPNEHTAYGLPLGSAPDRIHALDEACGVIRSLLVQHRSTVTGEHYQLADAACEPKPHQSRLPLLLGGGGEQRTLKVAARHADVWHTWATPGEMRRKNALLDRYCDALGRDPATISRATGGTVRVEPRQPGGLDPGREDLKGTADDVLRKLLQFRDAGVDEYIVRDDAANVSAERAMAQVDTLSDTVLPSLCT